jgi:sugar lactone lactonase YvrE
LSARVVAGGLIFPECPRWHDGSLWFVDMHGRTVWRVTDDGPVVVATLDDLPAGIGFHPDGALVVVARRRRQLLRVEDGGCTVFADLTSFPIDSLNDMVVDDVGRAYIGGRIDRGYSEASLALKDGSGTRDEFVILVTPDGSADIVARGMLGPNGTVVTPDGAGLIVAESRAGRLTAFRIEDDGALTERRVFAELGDLPPDGICLDAEGQVWAGIPLRGRFVRVRDGGEITDTIDVGASWAIACVLGGADRRTLFGAMADTTLENLAHLQADPDATSRSIGWIDAYHVAVPGAGRP